MHTLYSFIQGNINGVDYSAFGFGKWNGRHSSSVVTFDKEPYNFPVLGTKSWKCKNHNSLAPMDGKGNPFSIILDSGYSIKAKGLVTFQGIHGQIDVSAEIRREGDKQFATQNRSGYYDGPQDVVQQLDYVHHFLPIGPGLVGLTSLEQVVLSSGELMHVKYEWEYKIPVLADFEPFRVEYHIVNSSYENRQFTIGIAPKAFRLAEVSVPV